MLSKTAKFNGAYVNTLPTLTGIGVKTWDWLITKPPDAVLVFVYMGASNSTSCFCWDRVAMCLMFTIDLKLLVLEFCGLILPK